MYDIVRNGRAGDLPIGKEQTMKKRKTGWIIVCIIVGVLALLIGAYFLATRVLHVQLPFTLPFDQSANNEETVSVQSVANILGVGYTGKNNRYSGVVEAKEVVEINPDSNLTIEKCYVKAGDPVSVGTELFRYDVDSLNLTYEQTLIEITGLENTIKASTEEVEALQKRIEKAKADRQYELKLQLQEIELTLKRSQYELKSKQEQAAAQKAAIEDSVVKSPVAGKVRSVREENNDNGMFGASQESNAYITIVVGSNYCVKGKVNEQTVHTLQEGMPVTIRLRTDAEKTYRGEIYRINTEEPVQENSGIYYDGGSGERSSKYYFYVSCDSFDGLFMGQHVYIELGEPTEDEGKMMLPTYYVADLQGAPYVYAADARGRIEKRSVSIGTVNEEAGTVEIISGLSFTDKIAYPDDATVKVGMQAVETTYSLYAGEMEMMPEDLAGMEEMNWDDADFAVFSDFAEGIPTTGEVLE